MLTTHLLALELGPVVEIVSAARKTRDLWFGSWMLSEIAKATAKAVAEKCGGIGSLIFPAPLSEIDLAPESEFLLGDQILLKVPDDKLPADIARVARRAAHSCWVRFANGAKKEVSEQLIDQKRWDEQVPDALTDDVAGDVVECYAAWVPLGGDYPAARKRVLALLAGRTGCRNFPPAKGAAGVPKSSLDGRRESVLTQFDPPKRNQERKDRQLRLTRGEELDALGLTRRMFGGTRKYPSIARIAADPWIRGIAQSDRNWLNLLNNCRELAIARHAGQPAILASLTEAGRPSRYPQYDSFPFEGAVLYQNRHHEFVDESADMDDEEAYDFEDTQEVLKQLIRRWGEPNSYYCVLLGDGDFVGAARNALPDDGEDRRFSQRLSAFAESVRGIIQQHHGVPVFAAGEDITAFLPLDTALDCADQLRRTFQESFHDSGGKNSDPMSLSIGLVIGHLLDPLEDLLAAARLAEFRAKEGVGDPAEVKRNAIVIQYRSRGGAPIQIRRRWNADPDPTEINFWSDQLRNENLPDKVAYDLRRLAELYMTWPNQSDADKQTLATALQADVLRALSRKSSDVQKLLTDRIRQIRTPKELITLANTIIIARLILKAKCQAEVKP